MTTSKEQILVDRRYQAVMSSIADDSMSRIALQLTTKLRDLVAKLAGLNAAAFDDQGTLGAKIRLGCALRKTHLDLGILLSEPCTEYCIEALGSAADDPNVEHLQRLLPEVIDKFGLDMVRLMVVQFSVSLNGFKQLMAVDDRFRIPTQSLNKIDYLLTSNSPTDSEKRRLRRERQAKEKQTKQSSTMQRKRANWK